MNGHLKLLLIEDSDDDARLLLRALAKEGRSVDHQRVDNAQALAQALADGAFDAVICDYNLPGFSGVEAMRMVRESGQDIPLIMVSGTVGEEIAVSTMKLGASDFLLKRNIARLGQVLTRELREAHNRKEKRGVQLALADSEQLHRQVIQALPGAVYTCDAQGFITMMNRAAVELLGRSPTLQQDRFSDVAKAYALDGELLAEHQQPMAIALRERRPVRGVELVIEQPDGERRAVMPYPEPLFDSLGRLTGAVCMLVDVTDIRRYETELALGMIAAKILFDESPVAQLMARPYAPISSVNLKFLELAGYTREEILGRTWLELGLLPLGDDSVRLAAEFAEHKSVTGFHAQLRRKDGEIRFVELYGRTIHINGQDHRLHSFIDVTESRAATEQARLAQQCLSAVSEGVLISDPRRNTLSVNTAFAELTGYTQSELFGKSCGLLQGPQTDPDTVLQLRASLEAGEPFNGEILNYRKDGSSFWNQLSISPVHGMKGELTHFVGIQRDVTQVKRAESELRLAAQVFAQSTEGVTITDATGAIVMVNKAFTEILGYEADEVVGQNPRMLSSGRHGAEFYRAMWQGINETGHWQGEIWNRRKNGEDFPEWISIHALRDQAGAICNYVGTFSDISDKLAASERIEWLSNFDPLTKLPNRTLLADRCQHHIGVARRSRTPMAMLVIEVSQMREVNETMGHAIGDAVLIEISERLMAHVRECDTVSRIGGKSFAVVLPLDSPDGAAVLAMRLSESANLPFQIGQAEVKVSVAIGIASFPQDGGDFESLLKAAQFASHEAIARSDGHYRFFNADMFEQTRANNLLGIALRNAVADSQLQLVYQPFADLRTGRIAGAEALLRWRHPQLGQVSPAHFIPVAERSGVIIEIGAWVIEQACKDLRAGLDQGRAMVPVSVNLSPVQFREGGLIERFASALRRHRISPDFLCVEVTEGALIEDVERSQQQLLELKALGLRLSLDDFGTGYSSLSYLKLFPFDKVKIDQSFVRDIVTSTQDAVIAKVVISMAHGLGLQVVAEGVETEVQCEFMRNNACDEVQGYFFSRPVPLDALHTLLDSGHCLPAHLMLLHRRARTLMLVDDEPNVLAALKRLLRQDGYHIVTASSGPEGLDLLSRAPIDIIVSDQRMPEMTGVEFLRQAKRLHPDTIRIVLSGYTELQSVTDAINEGAVYRFLTKPWVDDQLRGFVKEAFAHKELADENDKLHLQVLLANQELAATNRKLRQSLDEQRRQLALGLQS